MKIVVTDTTPIDVLEGLPTRSKQLIQPTGDVLIERTAAACVPGNCVTIKAGDVYEVPEKVSDIFLRAVSGSVDVFILSLHPDFKV